MDRRLVCSWVWGKSPSFSLPFFLFSKKGMILNVYGPCSITDRRVSWALFDNLKNHFDLPWCLGGDFNEVRNTNERQGCSNRDRGMRDFNSFIEDMELVDLQLLGRNYTWSNSQIGEKWSRIDRFLLHNDWLDKLKLKQWGLPWTLIIALSC